MKFIIKYKSSNNIYVDATTYFQIITLNVANNFNLINLN